MQGFSIVMATRNRAEALSLLIPELLNLECSSLELIIVDNASRDSTRQVVASFPAKYIYFPGGLAEARHVGSIAATNPLLMYVDDDTRPGNSNMLVEIDRAFAENPSAGIVGSRIVNIGFKGMQQYKGFTRFGKNAMLEFEPNPPSADVFASMAITIRRDVYLKVGGFDPGFSRGCEEVDLCMKVKASGYRLVYQPNSFFNHYEMGSHFQFNPVHNRDYMRLYSFFKFFEPEGTHSWLQFIRNEWQLFLLDAKQIRNQYSQTDFRSTHLPFLNKALEKAPVFRKLLRWPLMAGAIIISPILRRLFIPFIYWKARRRKRFEQLQYGLSYA
jgi:GT2 family glycosyltransferase